jgi:hypothetical protein
MSIHKRVEPVVFIMILLLLTLPAPALSEDSKGKESAKSPRGNAVLWREPANIRSRDVLLGPGGAALRPDLRSLEFIEEEKGGYSTKYRVRDASRREWVAKIGKEAQSETAAVRLLWAIGYYTEINYLAPRVHIPGKGTFENVRFEARPETVKRLDEWKWRDNPFMSTREFQGLIIMMALVNNWDIKDSNNKILQVQNEQLGRTEHRYIISDLGATFGKVKLHVPVLWRVARNRNEPDDYNDSDFVEQVKDGRVHFFYRGKSEDLFDDIKVSDAKWLGGLLARLSDQQIRDAFRAANYAPADVQILARTVRQRINELVSLKG